MYIDNAKNLSDLFRRRVELSPDGFAYRQFDGRDWYKLNWRQAEHLLARWRAALAAEGLRPGDRIAICLKNCIEWVMFDQAAFSLGLVTVPLFYNDRPDNMAWCMQDAGVKLLVLGEANHWPEMRESLPDMQRVVCMAAECAVNDDRVVMVADWLPAQADAMQYADYDGETLATICYTSGTTGRPKGVMLTHNNIYADIAGLVRACPQINEQDEFLSFLPLSHMLERSVGYYVSVSIGASNTFARSVLDLAEDMVTHRPTQMVCVPRIFERIYGKVQEGLEQSAAKKFLFNSAVEMGWRRWQGKAKPLDALFWPVLDTLVGKKLRARLGGRIRYILLGGAPMAAHLFKTFIGLGVNFLHGYGLTETSPAVCFNRVDDNDPFSVGTALENVEVKLGENSELMVRSPIVMKGYWHNEEATKACIDPDGWFHTGDVADIRNNHIYITGRVKDIIVMSNGEKVAPGDLEQAIMTDPVFEQTMLIGEGRPKLGLLTVSKMKDEEALLNRANAQLYGFPGYVKLAFVKQLDEPWSVENGMLTPTLKVKRNVLEAKYRDEIERIYTDL